MLLLGAALASLVIGAADISWRSAVGALISFDDSQLEHILVRYQRLPRLLIALFVGAVMACAGAVLQALTRNPLASPALLGINAGAALAVVSASLLLTLSPQDQLPFALTGGLGGFALCLYVNQLTGQRVASRGLPLILAGAIVSMLLSGVTNTLLLTSVAKRADLLSWVSGNINHAYIERLYHVWWLGLACLLILWAMARPLTLITLGEDKARASGVASGPVTWIAFGCAVVASTSAVAICGPVGFVGLIVPHVVRPLVGINLVWALPANALLGATLCVLADLASRLALSPQVVHTGVMMDLLGGLAFAWIVRRYYLRPSGRTA